MAIAITGMHRSGTSMVARLLHEAGLFIGDEMMPAAPDNPGGFWEDLRFVRVNEQVLLALGGDWDQPVAAAAWADAPSLQAERDAASDLVRAFERRSPWGWKDPRTSLTLPFWLELVPDLKVVVCLRNPLEVSVSLQQRNGSSHAHGLSLWQEYNERILASVAVERRLVTHYSAYSQHPHAELTRLLDFCELEVDDPAAVVAAVVEPKLRHTQLGVREVVAATVPPPVLGLYLELCDEAGWWDADMPLHTVAPAGLEAGG